MELIKHQRSYHQTALAVLNEIVPELETVIGMQFNLCNYSIQILI